jgi:hypothetical protein
MSANKILSDKGLVKGAITVTIDGYSYRFKTAQRSKPVVSAFEKDENGLPAASHHVVDFEKLPGEIMAYAGTPAPSQLKPFLYDGKYWAVGNLTLSYSTENLRSYNCEVTQLAGTAAADFTETAA